MLATPIVNSSLNREGVITTSPTINGECIEGYDLNSDGEFCNGRGGALMECAIKAAIVRPFL
ncbi:MAG: hypothetical protein ACRD8Z_18845 [Nitrososphaeraceae archaeon]